MTMPTEADVSRTEMFLEGPGRLIRKVTPCGLKRDQLRSCRKGRINRLADPSEARAVRDSDGNIALQVDKEGWQFRFQGSPFIWQLLVG